jgi:hypothetical protein
VAEGSWQQLALEGRLSARGKRNLKEENGPSEVGFALHGAREERI